MSDVRQQICIVDCGTALSQIRSVMLDAGEDS